MNFTLHRGECLKYLRTLPDNSVDSVVTDPPYGLGREPDMAEVLRHWLAGDDYQHKGGGFMGKSWDSFVPGPAVWRECLRVLKPGGHLLSFFGTRTYDIGVLAIRLAGFEIRDQIAWVYGSGMPKGEAWTQAKADKGQAESAAMVAAGFEGWARAGLKPALEPIVVAHKPLMGTVAQNVLAHGAGALNIDGCRIGMSEADAKYISERIGGFNNTRSIGGNRAYGGGETMDRSAAYDASKGRWPANLVHDGSDEVVALFPADAGASAPVRGTEPSKPAKNVYGEYARGGGAFHGDKGSAARFFYAAKASRRDRNEGCEHLAERALHWSSGDANPGSFQSEGTKKAANNNHPTVKPTPLMRWLVRLVTPPGGTVLDPYTGSGSTGKAAILEGFEFIGCEKDEDEKGQPLGYIEIARARILWAVNQMQPAPANDDNPPADSQLSMF